MTQPYVTKLEDVSTRVFLATDLATTYMPTMSSSRDLVTHHSRSDASFRGPRLTEAGDSRPFHDGRHGSVNIPAQTPLLTNPNPGSIIMRRCVHTRTITLKLACGVRGGGLAERMKNPTGTGAKIAAALFFKAALPISAHVPYLRTVPYLLGMCIGQTQQDWAVPAAPSQHQHQQRSASALHNKCQHRQP